MGQYNWQACVDASWTLACMGREVSSLLSGDPTTARAVPSLSDPDTKAASHSFLPAYSEDSSSLLAATGEGSLQIIPLSDLVHSLHGAPANGLLPLSATGETEQLLTGCAVQSLQGSVRCLAVQAAKGRALASTTPGQLDAWRLRSSTRLEMAGQVSYGEHYINAMAFCAKTETLALVFADGTVRWSDTIAADEPARSIMSFVPVNACSFRNDGRLLATACADGDVRIWDTMLGET